MASTTNDSMRRKRHSIATDSDLIIIAKEISRRGRDRKVVCIHELEVSKEAISKNKYFNRVSFSKSFADTGKDFYEVKDDDPAALEIWLRLLHGCLDTAKMGATISNIWNVLVLAQKYDFDSHHPELTKWFFAWYEQNIAARDSIEEETCQEVLYPCYHFDHAPGFAAITKHLAYNSIGHIEEHRPEGVDPIHKEHHVKNNRVIGSLNGARGSLRIKLHNRLYAPCSNLLSGSKCGIKDKVFYQYHKALEKTEAWPIEVHGYKKSIKELLSLLKKFKYKDPHPDGQSSLDCMNSLKSSIDPQPDRQDPLDFTNSLWFSIEPRPDRQDPLDCMNSLKSSVNPYLGRQDQPDCMNSLAFSEVVENAISHVDAQFDGLCLDCMYCSINRDEDEEYWNHHEPGIWKGKCRIKHGQSTWYFSFLGRKEKMDKYQKRLRRTHA